MILKTKKCMIAEKHFYIKLRIVIVIEEYLPRMLKLECLNISRHERHNLFSEMTAT